MPSTRLVSMSDLRGWECEGAQLYNVRSIPSNVLIDQQGNIIAKDLRSENLLNKMAELLKKSKKRGANPFLIYYVPVHFFLQKTFL
jgi:hypothetical protein